MIKWNKVKAVLFDMDGVLLDTARLHYASWIPIAERYGIEFTWERNAALKGKSRNDSLQVLMALGEGIQLSEKEKKSLLQEKNETFLKSIQALSLDSLLPGISTAIKLINAAGLPIAIASGSKNARNIYNHIKLDRLIKYIVDGNDVQKGKPQPDLFLLAADLVDVDPAYCLVIEDSRSGVRAAKSAGCQCIGIGNEVELKEADHILENTADLPNFLSPLKAQ